MHPVRYGWHIPTLCWSRGTTSTNGKAERSEAVWSHVVRSPTCYWTMYTVSQAGWFDLCWHLLPPLTYSQQTSWGLVIALPGYVLLIVNWKIGYCPALMQYFWVKPAEYQEVLWLDVGNSSRAILLAMMSVIVDMYGIWGAASSMLPCYLCSCCY